MNSHLTRHLVNLHKRLSNTPKVHPLAVLTEVLATSVRHFRTLRDKLLAPDQGEVIGGNRTLSLSSFVCGSHS